MHMTDETRKRTPPPPPTDEWREIAERASREQDPRKLIELVQELCKKLEEAHGKPPKSVD
jgi:predicted Zn-dependent protease